MKPRRLFTLAALACAPFAAAEDADPMRYTLTTGVDYSKGDYGATVDTEMWYVPFTLKVERGPSTVKLTIPYLQVTGPGCPLIDGKPVCTGDGPKATEEGLGDVVVTYTHSLFERPRSGFLVDLGGKVKFPTADEDKYLGTGKADYAAFSDVYYLSGAFTPFVTVGYRVLGDPAAYELRDVWYGTLGLSYKLSKQDSFGAMWDLRQATYSGGDGINEATAYWVHKLTPGLKLQGYGVVGFSDASPDFALGFTVSVSP